MLIYNGWYKKFPILYLAEDELHHINRFFYLSSDNPFPQLNLPLFVADSPSPVKGLSRRIRIHAGIELSSMIKRFLNLERET